MSQVIVVNRRLRDGGVVEVDLSQDDVRFTVHVPQVLADSLDAQATYQAMGNAMVREHARLRVIQQANRSV